MTDEERTIIENSITFLIQEMLQEYSEKYNVKFDDALDLFTMSDTYKALYDFDSKLFREGPDYLLEWFERELRGKAS